VKHEERRKELGKVLMDTAKYLATVGLISGFLTNTLTPLAGLIISIIVVLLLIIGFFIIPAKKED
jgi:hypothetical protein